MKKLSFLLLLLIFIFPNNLISQSEREKKITLQIRKIGKSLPKQKDQKIEIKPFVKKFKSIAKSTKDDIHLAAISNALIGQELSNKKYDQEAITFLKKAFHYRKKEGKYFPQRWALNALIKNGFERNDFPFIYKYSKEWVTHTKTDPIQLDKLRRYKQSEQRYFESELENLLLKVHPIYISRFNSEPISNWDIRRKYSLKLLKFYLKKFPDNHEGIHAFGKEFHASIMEDLLRDNKISDVQKWVKQVLKILKKHGSKDAYIDHLRFFASFFRKSEGWELWSPLETTDHEHIGIQLIEKYIKGCKKQKDYDQVLFGYRYNATRYAQLNQYQKAIQNLATAIKYCHQYNLPQDIKKSYGGIHLMLNNVKNKNDILLAHKWKEGYSLKGLQKENISKIDAIIKSY